MSWIPLDIALYCGNRNLVSFEGNILEGLFWYKLFPCGIVQEDSESRIIIPVLKSSLDSSIKAFDGCCDGCFLVNYLFIG